MGLSLETVCIFYCWGANKVIMQRSLSWLVSFPLHFKAGDLFDVFSWARLIDR